VRLFREGAVIYVIAAWLVADMISGVVHWWEDRYGNPEWPILGTFVVKPNIRHHLSPRELAGLGYWERNWTTILPALIAASAFYACGWTFAATVAAMVSQANEVHAWSHRRCSRPVRGLQLLGVLCSPEQHSEHHRRPFDRNYCTMSDWMNPLLSAFGVWEALEYCVFVGIGVRPREERATA
jgi:ubiquitin-conjugating enzyme E2 variant